MCGIWGWVGKNPKRFNKFKFDLIGSFNEERGTDSCGVTVDGKIYYGLNTEKRYRNFVVNTPYPLPETIPTIFGHTRNSSVGAVSETNAHPFGFHKEESSGDVFDFIGVHNGTLYNHANLCLKYDIEPKKTIRSKVSPNVEYPHTKIDSEILLEILFSSKEFKVLEDYSGGAALIWYHVDSPNVVYCFHGKSALYYKGSYAEEERPLFFYRENKHSLWISSMKNSLQAIGGAANKILPFEHNVVYKITDGDIDNAVKFYVDRGEVTQKKGHTHSNYYYGYGSMDDIYDTSYTKEKKDSCTIFDFNIFNETVATVLPNRKDNIKFQGLQYLKNNFPINGVYVFIKDYGFYKMGEPKSFSSLRNIFDIYVDKPFVVDGFVLDSKKDTIGEYHTPFPSEMYKKAEPSFYYFIDGVRVRSFDDYLVISQKFSKADYNQLSYASTHPVKNNTFTYKPKDNQGVLYEGKLFTGTFSVLGSAKKYTFDKGNCTDWSVIENNPTIPVRKKEEKIIEAEIIEEEDEEVSYLFSDFLNDYVIPSLDEFEGISMLLNDFPEADTDVLKLKVEIDEFLKKITPQVEWLENKNK